jgi:hypothetical protein
MIDAVTWKTDNITIKKLRIIERDLLALLQMYYQEQIEKMY